LSSNGGKKNSSRKRSVECKASVWSRGSSRRVRSHFSRACSIALAGLCSSCAFFQSQPPLPKHAAIESRITPEAEEKFDVLVQNADIIYFPTELLESAWRSGPAWKLIEALSRQGNPFAIGSDLIAGDGQPLLDQWSRQQVATGKLLSELHLLGTARERENCRALLSETSKRAARFLALERPAELLPATAPWPTREDTAVLEEEFAADRIAEYFRAHEPEKVLVFVHRQHLGSDRGVPHLVAQKIKARQLVLDSRPHRTLRSQLVASRVRERTRLSLWDARRFEIVDGAPTASCDQF
jgi:hypothetical protein